MSEVLVIGAGTVGRVTGRGFATQGHTVTFADVDDGVLAELRADGLATTTPTNIDWDHVDVVFVCVPTRSSAGRSAISNVVETVDVIGPGLSRASQRVTVAVRSTLTPGSSDAVIVPRLEAAARGRAGDAFGFAVNPEFLRGATAQADFEHPWLIVIGTTDDRSAAALSALYAPYETRVIRCTPLEAELIKMGSNCFNALKISYFNELHALTMALGADGRGVNNAIAAAAEGMWNPAYGTAGGAPFRGACLPQDIENMVQAARDNGWDLRLIEAALNVNQGMVDGDDRRRQTA